ncbi:right-handed parallel beta-helix repeat-containing protein [Diplocloster modestus]|uniref:Right-handed parallel beta-helix repeat-containing protein n=1 Tax=Diplocloster modestus TaxID=2850322 RepID=A0ABS6K8J1_9FIRM|nr:right-handed parallel beta-helix repeat-containing protein [Diplocloster modestus]MBU9726831.1 right-handed parallel beta-helix repeat-containing protein [Diplocloster modestus]
MKKTKSVLSIMLCFLMLAGLTYVNPVAVGAAQVPLDIQIFSAVDPAANDGADAAANYYTENDSQTPSRWTTSALVTPNRFAAVDGSADTDVWAKWQPVNLKKTYYSVSILKVGDAQTSNAIPITIGHRDGTAVLSADFKNQDGVWEELGIFNFDMDTPYVRIDMAAQGVTRATQIRFEETQAPPDVQEYRAVNPILNNGADAAANFYSEHDSQTPSRWADSGLVQANRFPAVNGLDDAVWAKWQPTSLKKAVYAVSVLKIGDANTSAAQRVTVGHKNGISAKTVDFQNQSGVWEEIGVFDMNADEVYVRIDLAQGGVTRATAVRFEETGRTPEEGDGPGPDEPEEGENPYRPLTVPGNPGAVQDTLYVNADAVAGGDGSAAAPFDTMEAARDHIRTLNGNMSGNIIVNVAEGSYALTEGVVFEPQDGGTNGYQIIYQADNGTPEFRMDTAVTGWSLNTDGIWEAFVPQGLDFRQLYINGEKKVRARTPNTGETYTLSGTETNNLASPSAGNGFDIPAGLFDPQDVPAGAEIAVSNMWMHKYLKITGLTEQGSCTRVVLDSETAQNLKSEPQGTRDYRGAVYWMENAYAFIDQDGEWFLDSDAGKVYLKLEDNPNTMDVQVPYAPTIFRLEGTLDNPVQGITFKGLHFTRTGYTQPNHQSFNDIQALTLIPPAGDNDKNDPEYRYNQKMGRVPAAVEVLSGIDVHVEDCRFTDLGGNGLTIRQGGYMVSVTGCIFDHVAGSGIEIGDDACAPVNKKMFPHNITVENNYLHDIANEYYGGIGIMGFYAADLSIRHNDISNVSYSGISAGWGWGPDEDVVYQRNITIESNRIERACERLKDGGFIYTPNPSHGNNAIIGNYLVGSARAASGDYINGVYHDANSANWDTSGNVIEYVLSWAGEISTAASMKRNITLNGNYTTEPESSARLFGENVVYTGTNVVPDANWPEGAQQIIGAAGLSAAYDGLLDYGNGRIRAVHPVIRVVRGSGGTFTMNGFADTQGLTVTVDADTQIGMNAAGLRVVDTTTVSIPFTSDAQTPEGIYSAKLHFYRNGQFLKTVPLAVILQEDPANVVYVNIADRGYSEVGNFYASGLAGYATTSRYSADTGAKGIFEAALDGTYEVYVWKVQHAASDPNTEVYVADAATPAVVFDGTKEPAGWVYAGTFTFSPDAPARVTVARNSTSADGEFLRVSDIKFQQAESGGTSLLYPEN